MYMEYYLAIEKQIKLSCAAPQMELEVIVLSVEIQVSNKRQVPCVVIYTWRCDGTTWALSGNPQAEKNHSHKFSS